MHRVRLQTRLGEYRRCHPEESATIDWVEAFVAANADCFHRSCTTGHITGSAWIVDAAGERVLLTHHRKLDRWLQLGGHSDGDPDTLAVTLREAEEESGLVVYALDDEIFDLDVHLIPEHDDEPAHYHFDVRFLIGAKDDEFRASDESLALRWVAIRDLGSLTSEESITRMARKWRLRR